MRSVTIDQYMLTRPVTVKQGSMMLAAVKTILDHKISGVCVVDDNGRLVGMLSELDCLRAVIERIFEGNSFDLGLVDDYMTAEVETNRPQDQLTNVASSMLDHKHRRRPVLEGDRLVGQVTCRQILRAIKDFAAPSDPGEA